MSDPINVSQIIWDALKPELERRAKEYARSLIDAGFSVDEIRPKIDEYCEKFAATRFPQVEAGVIRRLLGGDVLH